MKLPGEWRTAPAGEGVDFVSGDGRVVVEIKSRAQGIRDLRAALMGLAVRLTKDPALDQALLAIHLPRATLQRIQESWAEVRSVLRPAVARRLVLAVFADGDIWIDPPTPRMVELARVIRAQLGPDAEAKTKRPATSSSASPFFFEITKVLLEAWLRGHAALQIQEIMHRVGCSHPTVAAALEDLERRREIERTRDRRVQLRELPRQTLEEMVVLSDQIRSTSWINDVSGRPPDTASLLRRLQRSSLPRTALGGVPAARHYHPSIDLHGTPRIDLTIWTPRGTTYDPTSVSRIYPGLVETNARQDDAAIAVHRISRANSLFEDGSKGLPYVDPVEALLDLYELRLTPQAQAFVKHLRGAPA